MSDAFEFTPAGIRPLQEPVPGGTIGAGDAIAALRAQVDAQEAKRVAAKPAQAAPRSTPAESKPLKPKSLIGQIRARLTEIRRELKRLHALELEAGELERLLAAAKAPPAGVTHINSARKSG